MWPWPCASMRGSTTAMPCRTPRMLTSIIQFHAYVLKGQAAPHLAAGRLARLLKDWTAPFPGYFLYYPSRRQMPPTLAALIAVLRRGRTA